MQLVFCIPDISRLYEVHCRLRRCDQRQGHAADQMYTPMSPDQQVFYHQLWYEKYGWYRRIIPTIAQTMQLTRIRIVMGKTTNAGIRFRNGIFVCNRDIGNASAILALHLLWVEYWKSFNDAASGSIAPVACGSCSDSWSSAVIDSVGGIFADILALSAVSLAKRIPAKRFYPRT